MELQWDDGRQELSYLLAQEETDTSVALKMIEYNQIPGLIPMHRQYIDEQIQLIYDVQGYPALQEKLEKRPVTVSWASKILRQILDVLLESEAFFLNMQDYCIAPDFIFFDRSSHGILLCYVPGQNRDVYGDFRTLLETVMEHLDHRNKEEIQWFYGLYDMHCAEEVTLAELRDHLERCSRSVHQELKGSCAVQQKKEDGKDKDRGIIKKQKSGNDSIFLLKHLEQRTLWKGNREMVSVLPEQFILCEGQYAVGRRRDQTLQLLSQQISREHALLEVDRNQIYLTDQGSANGTYVNHRKISAHVKIPLKTGDVITFADISYQLYQDIGAT
ncbi:MAG: FHA domain-containing protein [Lachnospiraceae bacterium]|nr:FHA domain-containing protein [Lachnospiraceae bacterium]